MFLYTVIEALAGIALGIVLVACTKKADGVVYGALDRIGRVTNILLAIAYALASPLYLFVGMICEPSGQGALIILGVVVSVLAASASLFCSVGLGLSVALRKKGKRVLSFVVQFAGVVAIVLTVAFYMLFEGSLISPLN